MSQSRVVPVKTARLRLQDHDQQFGPGTPASDEVERCRRLLTVSQARQTNRLRTDWVTFQPRGTNSDSDATVSVFGIPSNA